MEFKAGNRRRSLIKPKYCALEDKYPHFMQLYRDYPTDEISLKELEECTAERLAVLQIIDEVNARGLRGEEWVMTVTAELRKLPNLRLFSKLITCTKCIDSETDALMRRRDHISHFVLRMAYCINEEKKRWFISRETDLFKFRWLHLRNEDKAAFLVYNNINYDKVPQKVKNELELSSEGMIKSSIDYYKVPFTLVSDLIRNRKVYLQKGSAFITSDDIISVLLTSFKSYLSASLTIAKRRLHKLYEDERIQFILKGASKNIREVDYVMEDKDNINIATLDDLSASSYPLCMQFLHQQLKRDHHLKYFGRQQYGLFLKGIGVSYKDAVQFWRSEFTKIMDYEKFEKSYAYNIRHNFGLEGKKTNYSPYACLSIIKSSVAPGDAHGCPYRHKDQAIIRQMLTHNGLSSSAIHEILELTSKNQYQMACSKCFQAKHNSEFLVNHPNTYFDESQRILRGKTQPSTPTPSTSSKPNRFNSTPGKNTSA